jgi:hypothetical protein
VSDTTLRPTETPTPSKRGIRPIWTVLACAAVIIVLGALLAAATHHPGRHSHKIYEYTVPVGTVARIEAGAKIYIFPRSLAVRVGDQLVIHNDDTRVVEVGPYTVDRNATLAQTFNQPGTIVGICTIHPSGRVTINVRA